MKIMRSTETYLERRILHLMRVIEDMRDEALLTGVIGLCIGVIVGYFIGTMAG